MLKPRSWPTGNGIAFRSTVYAHPNMACIKIEQIFKYRLIIAATTIIFSKTYPTYVSLIIHK